MKLCIVLSEVEGAFLASFERSRETVKFKSPYNELFCTHAL